MQNKFDGSARICLGFEAEAVLLHAQGWAKIEVEGTCSPVGYVHILLNEN